MGGNGGSGQEWVGKGGMGGMGGNGWEWVGMGLMGVGVTGMGKPGNANGEEEERFWGSHSRPSRWTTPFKVGTHLADDVFEGQQLGPYV